MKKYKLKINAPILPHKSKYDPNGSYTGVPTGKYDEIRQDADDL